MSDNYLEFPYKSRYFTHGKLNSRTKQVWIACHGYGQLAKYFVTNFTCLDPIKHFIVVPEGTNRFYLSGFDGRVGASWMTKEDRETDILNYNTQLDSLLEYFKYDIPTDAIVNAFGFSQGTATISRWICHSKPKISNLYLWAGKIAFDIDLKINLEYLSSLNIQLIIGDRDQYINEEKLLEYERFLNEHNINFTTTVFKGDHKIKESVLLRLSNDNQD